MPQVLAVCDNDDCGTFFPAYEVEVGGPGIDVLEATLDVGSDVHVAGHCPTCGGTGHILGGVYNIVGDTLELLQGPERTVSELERLAQVLRQAQKSGAGSPEEIKSTVQREFPEWGQALAKLLAPKTPADFYALLAIILMVLEMILSDKQAGQTTNIEADQVINNVIVQEAPPIPEQAPDVAPSIETVTPTGVAATQGRKTSRNKPYPCGSGRKFKKCHGVGGATRYFGP